MSRLSLRTLPRAAVRNVSRDAEVGDRIAVAETAASRNRGLLGCDSLAPGEGLWIVPCQAIHMFFMRFAIDAVFLDRRRRVVKIVAHLRPWRMAGCLRAHSVLELAAGGAAAALIELGDQLVIER